jgi:hypothetical protein
MPFPTLQSTITEEYWCGLPAVVSQSKFTQIFIEFCTTMFLGSASTFTLGQEQRDIWLGNGCRVNFYCVAHGLAVMTVEVMPAPGIWVATEDIYIDGWGCGNIFLPREDQQQVLQGWGHGVGEIWDNRGRFVEEFRFRAFFMAWNQRYTIFPNQDVWPRRFVYIKHKRPTPHGQMVPVEHPQPINLTHVNYDGQLQQSRSGSVEQP